MDGFDLAAARKRKRIRQETLAARLELSINTVVDVEKGRIPLTPELLSRFLTAIDEAAEEKQAATA